MSEVRRNDEEGVQKSESCGSIDELQSDMARKQTEVAEREGNHAESSESSESSAVANEPEDTSPNGKRTSESSYGTENSILSSHQSLQALQALNSVNTQENDEIRSAEEICLYEQGPLNEITIEENDPENFPECDLSCSSPLLNGHVVDNDVHITTEKPQETQSEGNDEPRENGRSFSLFRRKPRTSPSNSKNSNGDVVINIDVEELTIFEPRPSTRPSFNDRLKGWFQPMDNKMNMKVFGSRKAMADELLRYSKAGWIIHPTSAFRSEKQVIVSRLC